MKCSQEEQVWQRPIVKNVLKCIVCIIANLLSFHLIRHNQNKTDIKVNKNRERFNLLVQIWIYY